MKLWLIEDGSGRQWVHREAKREWKSRADRHPFTVTEFVFKRPLSQGLLCELMSKGAWRTADSYKEVFKTTKGMAWNTADKVKRQIRSEYMKGAEIPKLARKFELSELTVYGFVSRLSAERSRKRRVKMLARVAKGADIKLVAQQYGVSVEGIKNAARREGIKWAPRKVGRPLKKKRRVR